MASFVPAKSQPLHNFELPPLLKWTKEGQSSGSFTKRRRSMKSPPHQRNAASVSPPRCSPLPRIPSPARQSPELAIGGDSDSRGRDWSSESEASRKGKDDVTLTAIEYHLKNCSWNSEEGKEMAVNDEEGEIEESNKLWNLRPRNVKKKEAKIVVEKAEAGKKEKCEAADKKKKLSICIALTKEEIEEDIYALTGTKASRRPKRRPKNVQKQLDAAFPGLWLLAITPESYKVSENSLKQG